MPRILVALRGAATGADRVALWINVDEVGAMRRAIDDLLYKAPHAGSQGWCVLAYEGLPDFGPQPRLEELLAYQDAVDDYGEPFVKLWATRHFDDVLQAADAFANTYQGTYPDAAAWARHYLTLIDRCAPLGPGFDFDAYGREAVLNGDVQFIAADGGGIHVFWND